MRRHDFDLLIVGAGPAGLAAAAAAQGAQIGIVDDNPTPGGQIWRSSVASPNAEANHLLARIDATLLPRTRVVGQLDRKTLLAETPQETVALGFRRLILATGARELFLPFPGWTLPGVMGAGGLQALVKGGLPIKGKRVVVAGSGPLLLAVAAHLREKGANVLLVAEQASMLKLIPFGLGLGRQMDKMRQAGGFALQLRGVPFRPGAWVTAAHGDGRLEAVTIHTGGATTRLDCDYLACAYGLVPNTELASMLGCELRDGHVLTDRWQQTSVPGVFCAGEATGVGGIDLSLAEGHIAGLVATSKRDEAMQHFPVRLHARRFAALLNRAFAPREEVKALADDDTIVCRCEDVTYGRLREHDSWRGAKLHTRCGMGPCQGRVCGAATTHLFGWTQDSLRPPLTVARIESLAQQANSQ